MNDGDVTKLADWVVGAGLAGASETALLGEFCRRATAIGLPVARAIVVVDTLHPILEGRAFRWRSDSPLETAVTEYGPTTEGEAAERWRRSPFYHLLESGQSMLRARLRAPETPDFQTFDELRAEGMVDYAAFVHRFAADGVIGEMDCVYTSWATSADAGFDDRHVAALQRLSAVLGLAVKTASLARIAQTLVETYLGRDPGRRVLGGAIARGVAEEIDAVIWYSDLRGYTRISDTAPPVQIIPLLNDYADAVITAVLAEGGDVLKLIGDGTLAIFKADDPERACGQALAAAEKVRRSVAALNKRRSAIGLPVTDVYFGLHAGAMFYGNIGSASRLDFTVVGPAVNEASRIASMCRSIEQPVLLSAPFVEAAGAASRQRFVSVGRYALRGVGRPQELYTIERF
ncbi:MAG TPA: adenylate/guanylate cyclase domain-containing protein [Stellaceae bacterium]|nr:adenylate/guanylate cyclase domain-containing protein [Stellaceae bacterium]